MPLSPLINTVESVAAMSLASAFTLASSADRPTMLPKSNRSRNSWLSPRCSWVSRRISSARLTTIFNSSLSTGLLT